MADPTTPRQRRPYRTRLTPEQLSERARNAALARTSTDAHIRALVDSWPPLTPEQRARLAALLQPGHTGDAATGRAAPG
jgi:hypothetical protein